MSSNKQGQYRKLDGKTIKDFMNTEVSDEVKFLLNPEISGLDKASKKEVFNSYPDFADNYNKYTEDKVRLRAVQAETEALAKVGKKTADQYLKVKADIAKQNEVLGKMSIKDIANNKELLNSVRMSINPKTGEVSYTNYTVNDPKGKAALTDLELAKKIKQKAIDKNFYVTEHIGKKSFNKANLAFPNNIQSANYMSNSQLENARRFLSIAENRNTPAAQNLDKTLENFKLTIRGPEYGDKRIGNKMDIVFDSKTGVSNIVQEQAINKKQYANLLNAFCKAGRIKQSTGTNPDGLTCSMEEIQRGIQNQTEKAKKVSKDGRIPKKFGKLRALGSALFGTTDPALEFMFAAPYLAVGDIEGAKRQTIFGGYGFSDRDISKMSNKEAQRFLKHEKATKDWMNNYFIAEEKKQELKGLKPNTGAFELATNQLNRANENMTNIADDYGTFGYSFVGKDTPLQGKINLQKQIRGEVAQDFEKAVKKPTTTLFFKDSDPEKLDSNIRELLGGDLEYRVPIKDLESYMANKGEPMAGNENLLFNVQPLLLNRATDYGQPELFDDYALGAGVEAPGRKSLQDAYSEIPLEYANQLAALEKKQLEEGLLKKELGLGTGFAGGGIAGLSGGDPEGAMTRSMNPDSQGLSYLMNRVKKVQE
jgi:hypothetical protein